MYALALWWSVRVMQVGSVTIYHKKIVRLLLQCFGRYDTAYFYMVRDVCYTGRPNAKATRYTSHRRPNRSIYILYI